MPELYFRPADRHLGNLSEDEFHKLWRKLDELGDYEMSSGTIDCRADQAVLAAVQAAGVAPAAWPVLQTALTEAAAHPMMQHDPAPRAHLHFQSEEDTHLGRAWWSVHYRHPAQPLGTVSAADVKFLLQHLVQEGPDDFEFSLDGLTFEFLHAQQMSIQLQDLLREALDADGEIQLLIGAPSA